MNPGPQTRTPDPDASAGGRPAFRRLDALARLGFAEAACLHLHRSYLECRRCSDACPQGCLQHEENALRLDPSSCSACGLCASACPTGALMVEGLRPAPVDPAVPLAVVCAQRGGEDGVGRQAVPCLAGLGVGDWLALAQSCGRLEVEADEGACASCRNARAAAPAPLAAFHLARQALAAAGVPAERLPQHIRKAVLPNGNGFLRRSPEPAPGSRRAFFAGLSRVLAAGAGRAVHATQFEASGAARPRSPLPSLGSDEIRTRMRQVARANGRSGPSAAWLPALSASAGCRAHGACASLCPTGALRLEDHGGRRQLSFDAWRCIACGGCERICPEQALEFSAPAWRAFVEAPLPLASVARAACSRCGVEFTPQGESALCDRCAKSQRLARAGFALFANPRGAPAQAP